jgi:SAM-dependent methyltransferase
MIKVEFHPLEQREDRAIFQEPRRYARQKMTRSPYLKTWELIDQEYTVNTALDLGCGLGVSLAELLLCGFDAYGIDGSAKIKKASLHPERFIVGDLRKGIKVKGGVDLIVCREVAEHLPFEFAEVLVKNIVRNCRVTYFTAATVGQFGSGHVNCQYQAFWITLFSKWGFEVDKKITGHNAKNHASYLDRDNGLILAGARRPTIHFS